MKAVQLQIHVCVMLSFWQNTSHWFAFIFRHHNNDICSFIIKIMISSSHICSPYLMCYLLPLIRTQQHSEMSWFKTLIYSFSSFYFTMLKNTFSMTVSCHSSIVVVVITSFHSKNIVGMNFYFSQVIGP